jgi:uncharacterized membrane protein YtjA (UPF0391 family)
LIELPLRAWHANCKKDIDTGRRVRCGNFKELPMLYYAITFFVIALIAAVLGFGGIAGAATGIAKVLFFVFLVLFVVSLLFGRRPRA